MRALTATLSVTQSTSASKLTAWRVGFWSAQDARSDRAPPTCAVLAALDSQALQLPTGRILPSECAATLAETERRLSLPVVRCRHRTPRPVPWPRLLPWLASRPATALRVRADTRCRWSAVCRRLFSVPYCVWHWRGSPRFAFRWPWQQRHQEARFTRGETSASFGRLSLARSRCCNLALAAKRSSLAACRLPRS
jgi:hypothetical protein